MGLALPLFALGFNALLWLGRAALAPAVTTRWGAVAGWSVAIVGPLCLLVIALRLRVAHRHACLFTAAASVAFAALCSGI